MSSLHTSFPSDISGGAEAHPSPWIYVVVPVYNRKALVERFLTCMRRQTLRNFTTVVVDDGSTDHTADLIRNKFSEVELLVGDGNLWWTGGINFGIRRSLMLASDDDAVLVINDDVEIEPDYLASLIFAWQRYPNALIGSVVVDVNNPDLIEDGGRLVNWWTAKIRIVNSGKRLRDFDRNYWVEVSMLTGWGTLVPVRVFKEIGLYDEKHFQQCGDTELTVRAKKRGYRLIVHYSAVVKVHTEQTAGINVSPNYSLADLKTYLFDVKSNCRLKYRFFFSYHTATSRIAFISFFVCDLARILIHFLIRLKLKQKCNG